MTNVNSRKINLSKILDEYGDDSLDKIIVEVRNGNIETEAYWNSLDVNNSNRIGRDKAVISKIDIENSNLKIFRNGEIDVHLVNSSDEIAYTEITMKTSEVNRALGRTHQSGGQTSKMGARVFAYLAALWSQNILSREFDNDAEAIFADLEQRAHLWDERGPIEGSRGIEEVRYFIECVEYLDEVVDELY